MRTVVYATKWDGTGDTVLDHSIPLAQQREYVRAARTEMPDGIAKVELVTLGTPLARTVSTEPAPKAKAKAAKKVSE